MEEAVEIERQERVFEGFLDVEAAVLRHRRFDGTWTAPLRRLRVERGDAAAAIVTRAATGRIVLVEQFRYPTLGRGTGWVVETVAGVIDDGERPEQTIVREIREEIGCETVALEPIATFFGSPGVLSERMHLFWATVTGDSSRPTTPDGEDVAVREYEPAALWAALDRGELADAKTIIAAMWLRGRLTAADAT